MFYFLLTVLMSFTLSHSEERVHKYVSYYKSGEMFSIIFNISNNEAFIGDTVQKRKYQDCSNKILKCIIVGDDYFFVPISIERSGKFESPFGDYIIYNNEQKLPFNTKINYKVIKIFPVSSEAKTLFYNEEKGVLAIIYDDNPKTTSPIIWLMGPCGLLANDNCK